MGYWTKHFLGRKRSDLLISIENLMCVPFIESNYIINIWISGELGKCMWWTGVPPLPLTIYRKEKKGWLG